MPLRNIFLLVCFSVLVYTSGHAQFIQLLGHHPGDTALSNSEIWGYEDPVTGKPYALMGTNRDLLIFDVSDPTNPVLTSRVPEVKGFDIKVWDHYVYAISGNQADSLFIIDVTDIANPVVVGGIHPGAHNIWIDEKGYLYATHLRIRIFDLNVDPIHPPKLWQGGVDGHDMHVFGDTLVYFAGYNGTYLFDITDRQFPIPFELIFDPTMVYHHSGWLAPDKTTLFIDDELAKDSTADITAWDISNPGNPIRIGEFVDTSAIVHNLFMRDHFAFTSYYKKGLRIFDVADPTNIHLVGEYKTFPGPVEESFGGAFGVYIFAPSRYVYVSDGQAGLFVFEVDLALGEEELDQETAGMKLWPNPVESVLNVEFQPELTGRYSLELYSLDGKRIAREDKFISGTTVVHWQWHLPRLESSTKLLVLRNPTGKIISRRKIIN